MDNYSEELKSLLKKSEIEAIKCGSYSVNSYHFLLAILQTESVLANILKENNIKYKEIKKEVTLESENIVHFLFDNTFKREIQSAFINAREKGINILSETELFLYMLEDKNSDIYTLIKKYTQNIDLMCKNIKKENSSDDKLLINELGTNLNNIVLTKDFNKVYKRDKEIDMIIEVLARKNKNNPLLIGEAGVGKTAIIEEISRLIVKKKVPEFLLNKKIMSLNISSVVAGTKYRGEFEEKLNKIIKEVESSNEYILFIDEIHTLMGAGGAEGAIDASNILKPFLARNSIKIIGATTINEYKKFIENDKAFDRRFQKILINEPSIKDTIQILSKIKKDYENFHSVKISKVFIKSIVNFANQYIIDKKEPDKSIDILDEACALTKINNFKYNKNYNLSLIAKYESLKNEYIKKKEYDKAKEIKLKMLTIKNNKSNLNLPSVTLDIIKTIIANKSNQTVLSEEEKRNKLKNLKSYIIGQEKAIDSLIRINCVNNEENPISILLSGPRGTGKTSFVLKYSEILGKNIINLNMNDYKSETSINRILGSHKGYVGYDDKNDIFESLKLYPSSVIMFDNIEIASSNMLNLIKKIIKEGKIINNKNEEINFKNSTIFIIKNESSNKRVGFKSNFVKNDDNALDLANYNLEFKELNEIDIKKIINMTIRVLKKEFKESFTISNKDIQEIILKSNYKTEGASKIYSILRKHIEYKLIKI